MWRGEGIVKLSAILNEWPASSTGHFTPPPGKALVSVLYTRLDEPRPMVEGMTKGKVFIPAGN
jgi:hypothetical protein